MTFPQQLANALRILSIDAVETAASGHPGMPLGMADIATVLWTRFLKHNPKNPHWFNRDRFVLSNGHGSMLLYALLHLSGYDLSLDDLKSFRQLHSKTPGHPEYGHTPGVETTTGPLGQGFANAVGLALAERILSEQLPLEARHLVDHTTYAFIGDGCLMEGISHEAASLAGTLGLGKLIVFYDSNEISIDGKISSWFRDDSAQRFKAYHWQVIEGIDGHDMHAIEESILSALSNKEQPTLIICNTTIGLGSSLAGTEQVHGAPLGEAECACVRDFFSWPYPPFEIPEFIYQHWNQERKGEAAEAAWLQELFIYQKNAPEEAANFLRRINGDLPETFAEQSNLFLKSCFENGKSLATRKASQAAITAYAPILPELLGGSADLTGSNNTNWPACKPITAEDASGNYIHYGVREFGMAAIMNGLALHGGFIPFGGTFLVFSDYARNAIRLSAMMHQRVIYVFSHDSIGLGEDGPTHQPIEHANMLRMTPGLEVWRPADLVETAVSWQESLAQHSGPSALLLSRQELPPLVQSAAFLEGIKQGGYILMDSDEEPEAILIATGSELQLAVAAAKLMKEKGRSIRVVSMPCPTRFLATEKAYQAHVLPEKIRKRIAIEAGATAYWYQFTGLDGLVIGIDRFGVSAPASKAYDFFGITTEHILNALNTLLEK